MLVSNLLSDPAEVLSIVGTVRLTVAVFTCNEQNSAKNKDVSLPSTSRLFHSSDAHVLTAHRAPPAPSESQAECQRKTK